MLQTVVATGLTRAAIPCAACWKSGRLPSGGPGGLEKFPGFDANNDDHYGVAQYLVDHLRRFTDLPGAKSNSHNPGSLPRYRAMYRIYEPLRPKLGDGTFTPDEFITIFSAT